MRSFLPATRLLALVAGTALLSSCSMILFVRVTNASAQDIVITHTDDMERSTLIAPGKHALFRRLDRYVFSVKRAAGEHRYRLSYEAEAFARIEGIFPFEKQVLALTYAADGCLYPALPLRDPAMAREAGVASAFPVCAGSAVTP